MNIKPVQAYQRSMRTLERQYIAEVRREFKTSRRVLLAEAIDRGIKDLPLWLDYELSQLRSRVKQVGSTYAPEVERVSVIYYDRQLRDLRRIGSDVPRAEDVRLISGARSSIDQVLMTDPAWIDTYKGLVLGTANQLVAADPALAGRRLFGANVVEGRASASRIAENRAIVGSSVAFWGSGNAGLTTMYSEVATIDRQVRKQVIAAVDERTTDCCLRAHGQIVGFDEPFKLSGTPRFADLMDYPPFHWNCRTSIAIHKPEMEEQGITTSEMRDAAASEIEARSDGSREEIHPASATSRRGS